MIAKIVELPEFHLVGMRGVFRPEEMSQIAPMWGRFVAHLPNIQNRIDNVSYGMCIATPDRKACEYTACIGVTRSGTAVEGLVAMTVPRRTYAVYTHEGHISGIGQTWNNIFDKWFKQDGLKHIDSAHDFERYDQRWNPLTAEGPVDIYLAIESPAKARKPVKRAAKKAAPKKKKLAKKKAKTSVRKAAKAGKRKKK